MRRTSVAWAAGCGAAALFLGLLGADQAHAATPRPSDRAKGPRPSPSVVAPRQQAERKPAYSEAPVRLRDGARLLAARRTGPAALDALGRLLRPVRLEYANRPRPVDGFVDDSALVQIDPRVAQVSLDAERALDGLGARVVRPLMPSIGLWLVQDSLGGDGLDVAARLAAPALSSRGIRQSFPNVYLRRKRMDTFVPNDPMFTSQWFFANLGMTEAWGLESGNASSTIVVVDTGCDMQHPDLAAKMDPGKDVVDGDDDPSPLVTDSGAAHGTACAGLVGAVTDNGLGVAGGCPGCRIRCVRLLADVATPTSADVDAFQFALDVNAAVVSNSWGFVDPMPVPQTLADAINNVFDNGRGGKGALVLFAAGNDSRQIGDDELEATRGVLAIGAINNMDEQTPYTNTGNAIDLVAYTGTVTTDISGPDGFDPSDYTTLFGGTSSACPVAAGIAGLLTSADTTHTSADLYQILIDTAKPAPYAQPDANGHDPVFGYGIINPVRALRNVLGLPDGEAEPDAGPATAPSDATDTEEDSGCSLSSKRKPSGAELGVVLLVAALGFRLRRTRSRPVRS